MKENNKQMEAKQRNVLQLKNCYPIRLQERRTLKENE